MENNTNFYLVRYNLCGNEVNLGCSDYQLFLRSDKVVDEEFVFKEIARCGKSGDFKERITGNGFKFSLYEIKKLSLDYISNLGFSFDSIPLM